MDGMASQKAKEETRNAYNTMDPLDRGTSVETLPTTAVFSSTHGAFSTPLHVLAHTISLVRLKGFKS
jgi:hypothetical protein